MVAMYSEKFGSFIQDTFFKYPFNSVMYMVTSINVYFAYTRHSYFCCLKSIHYDYIPMVIVISIWNWGVDMTATDRWGEVGEYTEVYSFLGNIY